MIHLCDISTNCVRVNVYGERVGTGLWSWCDGMASILCVCIWASHVCRNRAGMNPKCSTTCSTGFYLREGKLCNSRYWVFMFWAQSKSDTHFNPLGVTERLKDQWRPFRMQHLTPFFFKSGKCVITTISWSSCEPHCGKLYDGPGSACHPARQVAFSPAYLFSLSLFL